MMLYNVTVKIDNTTHDEWLQWMQEVHIPEVMSTGLFQKSSIARLLEQDETEGKTYAIQYTCRSMEDYEQYQKKHAPRLQEAHSQKFKEKFAAFRTLLEVIS